jgi:hypothetical protein
LAIAHQEQPPPLLIAGCFFALRLDLGQQRIAKPGQAFHDRFDFRRADRQQP